MNDQSKEEEICIECIKMEFMKILSKNAFLSPYEISIMVHQMIDVIKGFKIQSVGFYTNLENYNE